MGIRYPGKSSIRMRLSLPRTQAPSPSLVSLNAGKANVRSRPRCDRSTVVSQFGLTALHFAQRPLDRMADSRHSQVSSVQTRVPASEEVEPSGYISSSARAPISSP